MKYRNSVSYFITEGKSKVTQNNKQFLHYRDKTLKNYFLNNLNERSLNNTGLIKNLSNTFRNYELNLNKKDIKIADNLYNISVNNVFSIKNKLKKVYKLYQQYDEQFSFNPKRDLNKINVNKTYNENNENFKFNNQSLNISNITKNNYPRNSNEKNKSKDLIHDTNNLNNKELNFNSTREIKKIKLNSTNLNKENNGVRKYKKFIINEKNMKKQFRKIEQINKLLNAVDDIKGKEEINKNKFFQVNKPKTKTNSFFREIKNEKKFDYHLIRKRNELKKINQEKFLSEEKTIYVKNMINNFPEKNSKNKNFKKNLTSSDFKSNSNSFNNINNENLEKFSLFPNIKTTEKDESNYNYSSSFPNLNFNSKKIKNKQRNSLINLSPINKKKIKLSLTSYKKNNAMKPIILKTINEGKKITEIIKRNYRMHKESKIKNNFSEILDEEQKLDLKKLRKTLKLKYSNGIYGEINEVHILDNNIKKMKKYLTPKGVNFIKYIAKGMIKEDLLLNKNLVYNVGLENRDNRKKYIELYNILNNYSCKFKLLFKYYEYILYIYLIFIKKV